ncbi:MAG: hypothetical protein ABIV47_23415 [Roseiflexaceae bacterium]
MSSERLILFVSDNAAEAKLCELILHHKRQDRVILVPCIPEAIRIAVTEHLPNAIFIDHGYNNAGARLSLYQAIRTLNDGMSIPVVFWRTDMFSTRSQEAITLGLSGYIPVVCQPDDIVAAGDAAITGATYFPQINQGQYRKIR